MVLELPVQGSKHSCIAVEGRVLENEKGESFFLLLELFLYLWKEG